MASLTTWSTFGASWNHSSEPTTNALSVFELRVTLSNTGSLTLTVLPSLRNKATGSMVSRPILTSVGFHRDKLRARVQHLAEIPGPVDDVGSRLQPLIVLMLGSGLRRGEALALHWRDVDLSGHVRVRWTLARVDRRLVFDEPKTERSRRFVSLPSPVVELLRRHKAALAAERLAALAWAPWEDHDDLVFPTHIGTPTDPRNALQAFANIAERAGLAGVTLHTLRHSAASALIASSAHIRVVQELLGHSSYGITADIYSHVAIEQQREAAERLGEVPMVNAVTAVVTAVRAGPDTDHVKSLPLGPLLSGWRDLNSRPLDPQIGLRGCRA